MAGTSVSFGMDLKAMRKGIAKAAARIRDRHTLAEDIGEMLVSSTLDRFESGQGPDGTPWEPSQRAEREGGKTLVDKAILRNSIGYEASSLAVVVGSNMVYARPHQEGADFSVLSTRRRITLPARPFLGISDEDLEEAGDLVMKHIAGGFRR